MNGANITEEKLKLPDFLNKRVFEENHDLTSFKDDLNRNQVIPIEEIHSYFQEKGDMRLYNYFQAQCYFKRFNV